MSSSAIYNFTVLERPLKCHQSSAHRKITNYFLSLSLSFCKRFTNRTQIHKCATCTRWRLFMRIYIGGRCWRRARPDITRLVQVAGGGFFIGHKTKPQRAPVPQVHLTISPFSLTRSTSIPSSIGGNVNFQGDLIEVSFALESTGRKTARLR